jgi:adenylate cyclase
MAPSSVERKLTTILCADVEGYSRLMGRDEVGTLETLRSHRAALAGLVERHRGRVVNTWGDGLIADFPSVVEAVRCAVEAQRELRARNDVLDPERRLEFRVGINLGDVMVEPDGDLYGEGVNVAARLQALAEPGGVVISGAVHDLVRAKLAIAYEFAGPQSVKNIAEPVPAYRVLLDGAAAGPAPPRRPPQAAPPPPATPGWSRGRRSLATFAVATGFLLLVNLFANAGSDGPTGFWFQWPALVLGTVLALRWVRSR